LGSSFSGIDGALALARINRTNVGNGSKIKFLPEQKGTEV
jgi:hypothetical protein